MVALVRPESNLWRLADVLDDLDVAHANLSDLASAGDAIMKVKPEIVVHLAWSGVTSAYRNQPDQITENVTGSLQLFQLAQAAGCRCWIGVGSQAEYGPYDGLLTEDVPTKPVTAYGVSKLCVGLLTQKLCELSQIRCVWLRLLATYGPKDDERHLIPAVIRQLLVGQAPSLTLGKQEWDYLYVEDAAEAICRTALVPDGQGVYNLGSGQAFTIRSIVERIRDLIDPSQTLRFGDVAYPPDQVMRLQADISRLQTTVGWAPTIELDEGLRRTVEWYKSRLMMS